MSYGEFTCGACHQAFEKAWPDEDAIEEMRGYFGDVPEEEQVVICDDCFERMHPARYPEVVEATRVELAARRRGVREGKA